MIRKVLLSTVAIVAITGTAFAADLPSRRAPPVYVPPPVPVFTWTGFYVGADVGYGFGNARAFDLTNGVGPYDVGQNSSVVGGVHVGYNYELGNTFGAGLFGGGLVVGVEGDIMGSNNSSSTLFDAGNIGLDQHKNTIEGSVRGRLGIAVDRALFFVTGGAAFAQFKDQYNGGVNQFSTSRIGYTVGGGVEYAVTPNWLLRGEYLYSDFGTYALPAPTFVSRRVQEQKALVGVSYLFSMPVAPVVARY